MRQQDSRGIVLARLARELADDSDLLAADETRKQLLFRTGRLNEMVLILSVELKSATEQLEDLNREATEGELKA